MTAAKRLYTPFSSPYRMAMGVRPLAVEDWIEIDGDLNADLREKRRLLDERHGEVFAERPGSEPAQAELLQLLAAHLVTHASDRYRRDGSELRVPELGERYDLSAPGMPALDLAGRLVQEDLCLMQRREGVWRLTAASVCFPTRWNLVSKMGLPLADIHDPVPGFRETLAEPVTRFFDLMRVEKPVYRLNWSLLDDPALFQPSGHYRAAARDDIDADTAGEKVWLRVERQTLRRLPQSDAIVFTIRIHRWPLSVLAGRPDAAAHLRGALETMPTDMRGYKSVAVLGAAVAGYLDGITAKPQSDTVP